MSRQYKERVLVNLLLMNEDSFNNYNEKYMYMVESIPSVESLGRLALCRRIWTVL